MVRGGIVPRGEAVSENEEEKQTVRDVGSVWVLALRHTPGITAAILLWFALDQVLGGYNECMSHLADLIPR